MLRDLRDVTGRIERHRKRRCSLLRLRPLETGEDSRGVVSMKWMKHPTDLRDDEDIAEMIARLGMEGYGFYWAIKEIVARKMDGGDKCEATYPLREWARLLGCHHNKARLLLGNFS
jgi:hypothetical protein